MAGEFRVDITSATVRTWQRCNANADPATSVTLQMVQGGGTVVLKATAANTAPADPDGGEIPIGINLGILAGQTKLVLADMQLNVTSPAYLWVWSAYPARVDGNYA